MSLTISSKYSFFHFYLSVASERKESNDTHLVSIMTREDTTVLDRVTSSFPCWQDEDLKQSFLQRTDWPLTLCKFVGTMLFILVLIIGIGSIIRCAKDVSIWFFPLDGHSRSENSTIIIL